MRNIDFHAHILPAADHGSESLQMSMQQLALAKQAGIDTIVATPHFYPYEENIDAFLTRRERCAKQLFDAMQGKDLPRVLIGAEVQLRPGLDQIERLNELCIEGTDILLLELPREYSLSGFDQVIDTLLYSHKMKVVLAHIDRYHTVHVDFLIDCGCLAQINAEAMCYHRSAKRCELWLDSDSVVALGSDIHGLEEGYRPFLKAKKRLGAAYDQIMHRTQALLG